MNQGQNIPNQTENLNTVPVEQENKKIEKAPEAIIENQPSSVPLEQPTQNAVADDTNAVAPMNDLPVSDDSSTAPVANDNPIVNDVVENKLDSTWVEKAEDIIKKDKEDPYQEEVDHGNLQGEYLKQRFGKSLKSNDLKE